MKEFNSLESMRYYRERLILPHDPSNKQKGSVVYFLNTSKDSIAQMMNNEHPIISNMGAIYKTYYYDHTTLVRCIKSDKIKGVVTTLPKAKATRLVDYADIDSKVATVRTPIMMHSAMGYNMVYDMSPVEKLYSEHPKIKKLFINAKLTSFFNTFESIYQHELVSDPPYTKYHVMVNLDEYVSYVKNGKADYHILSMITLLLRRNEKFIANFTKYTMKFLFYSKNGYFVFDMSTDLIKSNLSKLRTILKRMGTSLNPDVVADNVEAADVARKVAISAGLKKGMTGDIDVDDSDNIDESEDDIISTDDDIVKTVTNKIDDVGDLDNDTAMTELEEEIFSDEETKKEYIDAVLNSKTKAKSNKSLERDKLLREKQKDIVIKTKTIGELKEVANIPDIPKSEVKQLPKTYKNVRNVKFANFEKTYMENVYEKHIGEMITCMNDKSLPVTVVDVKVKDTSDSLTMKETYTVILEDENRRRHTLKFNLPKFIDNKFMYINGNKKTIQKQFFVYPVVKTGPDEVQICTNYQKIFINRVGRKFSQNSERFRKLMTDPKYSRYVFSHTGCNTNVNKDYLTCLEYDEFAKSYNVITVGSATFMFNMKLLEEELGNKYHSNLDKILVGYTIHGTKKEPIFYDTKNADHTDLITLMVSYIPDDEVRESFSKYTVGKKYVHTTATIMTHKVPVAILLSFFEGLDTLVRKFNDPTVVFSDKKNLGDNYMYIKFVDGYLCYPMSNMEACMMFNGFTEMSTSLYTIDEMNNRTTYLDIFKDLLGTSYVAGGFINYYEFMIDPITLEVLQLLQYPTDIVSLTIFANNMLADNRYTSDQNLNQYRLRENEIVAAILYKNIARAYSRYRQTANNPNPVKITMDENAVIKELLALPTVEDYSTLSPMVEIHKSSTVSMKGPNGLNLDRAYKADKRAFDDSMIGVCGISTDPGPNCGKVRQLVAEPTVTNALGFMDLNNRGDLSKLNDTNLSVPVEMLTPMSATHDDPNRNAMATKQTCHVIPVRDNCPVLISTGMDQSIHYRTGNDFSVVAKQDGKVVEYNEKNHVMVVEYKDGTKQAVDIAPHAVKNGGGGFYLVNQLVSNYKLNQTFKKDDILAYDPKYYKEQGKLGNRLTMGSLTKVACLSNFATFEDSAFITKRMSEAMATDITMQKTIVLGANANIDYIVKPGQDIRIGDDLIRYEMSYDDSELNKLLSNIRDDMKEEIVNLGKSKVASSYTGVVSDVVIYSTCELDELSPTLRKVVKDYQDNIKSKEKVLDKYDKDSSSAVYRMGVLMDKPSGTIKADEYGKVKGYDVGRGVLIEFYITYHDELSDGDKLSAFTANKNTIGFQVKRGYEPYSEFRPYEEISAPVAPSAILQRNTPSMIITGCAYKVLIELKRKMYEILTGENFDEVLKQKQPYMSLNNNDVKESYDRELTDKEVTLLESVYSLEKYNDYYRTPKGFCDGDMIIALNENVDMSKLLNGFKMSCEDYNAVFDYERGIIIATEMINPYDDIIINLEP